MAKPRDQSTGDEVLDRFAKINIWRRGDERAPHKPLLLLFALAALQRGEDRLIPFKRIEEDVGRLLAEFGPPRTTRPEYPFWHLQSDGLWEIPERTALQADLDESPNRHNPRLTVIRGADAHGGLTPDLFDLLRARPDLVNRIAARLLEDHWEPSFHDDILDAVGMPYVQVTRRRPRDPAFRDTILRIYQHRCAICGYDALLGTTDLGIEAAHIHWHCHGGPDTEENGLALCANHHKAFDRGALGLDDDHRILISQHLRDTEGARDWLIRFAGEPIRGPQPGCSRPAPHHVKWHLKEVFREPARETHSPEVPT